MHKFFAKAPKKALDQGLTPTKQSLWSKIGKAIAGKSQVDEMVLDELEEVLIAADVGVATTVRIIERLEQRVARDKYLATAELDQLLKEEMTALLTVPAASVTATPPTAPYVVLVVGVNGVGKTTTIGKLAAQYKQAGKQVILGAADTFRQQPWTAVAAMGRAGRR